MIELAGDGRGDRGVPREAGAPGRARRTRPTMVLASMGNYVFDAQVLIDAVTADAQDDDSTPRHRRRHHPDAGRATGVVGVVGLRRQPRSRASPSASAATGATSARSTPTTTAHMDLISAEPIFNLYNEHWPILKLHEPLPRGEVRPRGAGPDRHGARLDGLRGRDRLRRRRAPLGALARGARPLGCRASRARSC